MNEKNISSLLSIISYENCVGNKNAAISSITLDSRNIIQNTLFIAQKGETVDGHQFIEGAIEKGAAVIVCEILPHIIHPTVTYIEVKDSHYETGIIASWYYDFPTRNITLIGVTGTNGKTTVATLLWQSLRLLGNKVGLISTVSYFINEQEFPSSHTTPDAITLQKNFRLMADNGCTHIVMEVSSHAIAQKRIAGVSFEIGIFTNLTQDHLDFHKTMEAYRDTKKEFFTSLPVTACAITNSDDPYGLFMVGDTIANKKTYSVLNNADYCASAIVCSIQKTQFFIEGQEIVISLIGTFNLSNSLAVYTALRELNYKPETISEIFPKLLAPSGRFEVFQGYGNRVGIVDYAHTPDGLEKLLTTLKGLKQKGTSLIVVFGCGGNRDSTKRPIMGSIAVTHADYCIITSDNPRNEDPQTICSNIAEGIPNTVTNYTVIVDRESAIKYAVEISKDGDTVVVAGKGHEQFQIIGDKKIPFSDQEILSRYLAEK